MLGRALRAWLLISALDCARTAAAVLTRASGCIVRAGVPGMTGSGGANPFAKSSRFTMPPGEHSDMRDPPAPWATEETSSLALHAGVFVRACVGLCERVWACVNVRRPVSVRGSV